MSAMDPRLDLAIDASRAWYDDIFALHRIPTTQDHLLWRSFGDPPPYHSAVKTLRPGVPSQTVLEAAPGAGSIADSFADLDLAGWSLLLEATWVHHPGAGRSDMPAGWSVLTDARALATWTDRHDYAGVLTAEVLDHPAFTILGCHDGEQLVGGAVLHDASPSVGLSNAWASPGHSLDWDELLAAARTVHPDRPVTGYARGEDLAGLLVVGFGDVGTQRVWAR